MKSTLVKAIESGECFITSLDDFNFLYTTYLRNEIAVAVWSKNLNLAILGRCLTGDKLKDILKEIAVNAHNSDIQVTIVGGDDSPSARTNLEEIVQSLQEIDQGRAVFTINVLANDVLHPDFCILNHESGFTL